VQLERAAVLRQVGVRVQLGGDGIDAIGDAATVVKSPGVPPEIPVVAEALRRGLPLVDELEIGWHLVEAPAIAVTGTNGKSTTTALCHQLLRAHGLEPVLTGNSEFAPPLSELALGEPPGSVAVEVSSYQTEFARSLAFDAAVFTNLARDHLNRHTDMEAYGAAKRRLFVRGEWCIPLASINFDDAFGRRLAGEIQERGGTVLTHGFGKGADYRIAECRWGLREAETVVEAPDGTVRFESQLPGPHNALNATAALALADGLELPREETLAALSATEPVPGRFEPVEADLPFDVVVDYAYARSSVEAVLRTGRRLVAERNGRLLAVLAIVGRAGPIIGREVAERARELSDHLVLCASSYRGEPRMVTLAEMAAGARAAAGATLEIVIDRRKAIARALERARPGDLVMILGRGPTTREATDWRGGFVELDDRQVVREMT
jgi:UDP-N-acetylmuramoyl-L-alanyl-D-glutamate--2,6-diaminopimelate ligase